MEAIYNVNWNRFVNDSLPNDLRLPIVTKWLLALVSPLLQLYVSFLLFREQSLYKVTINSQVVYLQKMLNDKFDPSLRRIRIANAVIKEPVWFYEPDDDKPVWFYEGTPVYFKEESELVGDGVDFTVLVPADLRPSSLQMEEAYKIKMSAQINYYKLFSKSYQIAWTN